MKKKIEIAKMSKWKDGEMKSFAFATVKGIAIRRGDTIQAFVNRCTHMGGPLEWKGEKFECRWHGACFDAQGLRCGGEAPEGSRLTEIPLEQEGDAVFAIIELPKDPFDFS